jgi:hypothetical protein
VALAGPRQGPRGRNGDLVLGVVAGVPDLRSREPLVLGQDGQEQAADARMGRLEEELEQAVEHFRKDQAVQQGGADAGQGLLLGDRLVQDAHQHLDAAQLAQVDDGRGRRQLVEQLRGLVDDLQERRDACLAEPLQRLHVPREPKLGDPEILPLEQGLVQDPVQGQEVIPHPGRQAASGLGIGPCSLPWPMPGRTHGDLRRRSRRGRDGHDLRHRHLHRGRLGRGQQGQGLVDALELLVIRRTIGLGDQVDAIPQLAHARRDGLVLGLRAKSAERLVQGLERPPQRRAHVGRSAAPTEQRPQYLAGKTDLFQSHPGTLHRIWREGKRVALPRSRPWP